jgi:hypothetical protein
MGLTASPTRASALLQRPGRAYDFLVLDTLHNAGLTSGYVFQHASAAFHPGHFRGLRACVHHHRDYDHHYDHYGRRIGVRARLGSMSLPAPTSRRTGPAPGSTAEIPSCGE